MKRLIEFFARLYPAAWRNRYQAEFDALLADVRPNCRAGIDVLKGAVVMQLRAGNMKRAFAFETAMGLAGLLIGLAISLGLTKQYVSQSLIRISSNPAISKSDRDDQVVSMARAILSRSTLRTLIQTYGLYPEKRAKMPLEDVVAKMINDITIRPVSIPPVSSEARVGGLSIQFLYQDPAIAQRVNGDLVARFMVPPFDSGSAHRSFVLELLDAPSRPQTPISPNPFPLAMIGLGAGMVVGLSVLFLRRSPKAA